MSSFDDLYLGKEKVIGKVLITYRLPYKT